MARLRNSKEYIDNELKIKKQKVLFSICFIFTIIISFLMLVICAINNAPTLITTVISGSAWLLFDILYACAVRNKWHILFDECSTGRVSSFDFKKTETERKEDNWQGNCLKFAISVIVVLIHLILFFTLL